MLFHYYYYFDLLLLLPLTFTLTLSREVKGQAEEGSNKCDDYLELSGWVHEIGRNYSGLARVESIGRSGGGGGQGRELWTVILSDAPVMRPLLRPQVKLIANVNGVSRPACELLIRLIQVKEGRAILFEILTEDEGFFRNRRIY
jgi:hypothetical protein